MSAAAVVDYVQARHRTQRRGQIDRELPDVRALHAQPVIGVRAGERELALDRVQPVHLVEIFFRSHPAALRERRREERRRRIQIQEIEIQRHDYFGLVALGVRVERLAEGHAGSG